ncbi:hypothetical protein QSH18_07860 [Xanthomonas sp. NCPPB 2654]|uniref:hypothetical protein n=1 Tax=unclassified Xanthomonas TaxID=2643310 RepID=UPI0021E010DE|nr:MULTISPECIES: hypothetical protein [unclassified Xanthomonas]MDL5365517.1 hypothetical protein [Xanthomonas sp. NCPPB 2654]UYC19142.1 hypothetical protein NUG20_13190 [Xanthomonas sp. CFBP 8443]
MRRSITPFEFAALAYLAVPVALFFLVYARFRYGLPLAGLVGFSLWQCWRLVDRRSSFFRPGWVDAHFLGCAALIVFVSGSFGGAFFPNSDWFKHFGVLRFLVDNEFLTGTAPGYDGSTMRYYLGWYVVPALLTKAIGQASMMWILGTWTTAGLYLFFRTAAQLSDSARWRYALPAVFLAFSGADALGSSITEFSIGPKWHIEWWAGWVQYSSMITDIFWAPQHALSAWLGAALALRLKDNNASLVAFPLATATILMWSPFSAIGLAPFYLWTMARSARSLRLVEMVSAAGMLAVTVIILLYLRAGDGATSMVFVTVLESPCLKLGPCYTAPNYLSFLAIEILGFLIILHFLARGRSAFLWIATVMLLLLPFAKFGGANDLNLHASIPPLALIAVCVWQALQQAPSAAAFALGCLLAAGAATPLGEIRRSFLMTSGPTQDMGMDLLIKDMPSVRGQYLIETPPWMLRKLPPQATEAAR